MNIEKYTLTQTQLNIIYLIKFKTDNGQLFFRSKSKIR